MDKKEDPTVYCFQEMHLNMKAQSENYRVKNLYHANLSIRKLVFLCIRESRFEENEYFWG